jgi:hypothetical protein
MGIKSEAEAGTSEVRAWVAAANMGLGHKRAVNPLQGIAEGGIIVVNSPEVAPPEEQKLWDQLLSVYERLSRAKSIPLIGNALFGIMDYFQRIKPAYPRVDLSSHTVQTTWNEKMIDRGICKGMMERIRTKPLPLISSYFTAAIAADRAGYGRVYCIICDADINRVWVASDPKNSRIEYLVPCGSAMRRLKQYGVPDERIYMTGFPLPLELLGDRELDVLKRDLGQRLRYLDPTDRFWPLHDKSVEHFLGAGNCSPRRERALTLAFCVGGAGAQKEIAAAALASLKPRIQSGQLRMNLVCGVRPEVRAYFEGVVKEQGLEGERGVRVIGGKGGDDYFETFNKSLHETDIIWTKPSEMSFYVGLGIPIIMAPSVGSQEVFNRRWLEEIQAGIPQNDPRYADQWIFELLEQGRFAEAAWSGFLKARKYGTYKIHELIQTGTMSRSGDPLTR